jgi:type II secretory pathway pseudopilin PulG
MPQHRERLWPRIVGRYAVLLVVLAAVAAFVHDTASPADRAVVIRLAVAFAVAGIFLHLRSYFRGDPRWDPLSEFEEALNPKPTVPNLAESFRRLREQVESSIASRSYFERGLWPRLQSLARARGRKELSPPEGRGWLGRGPSRRAVAELIDRIETGR